MKTACVLPEPVSDGLGMGSQRMFAKCAILLGLVFLGPFGAAAQDLLPLEHVVVFNNHGRQPPNPSIYPVFRLSERFALIVEDRGTCLLPPYPLPAAP